MKYINEITNGEVDLFNINESLFNDICYIMKSQNGTDVTRNKRKEDYYQDINLCGDGCIYEGFNYSTNSSKCKCSENSNDSYSDLINKI